MYSITNEQPEPMTALRTGVPMELEWLANKCLAKDIEERYQHTDELLLDLQVLRKKLDSGKSTIMQAVPGESVAARHAVTAPPQQAAGTRAQHAVPLHSGEEMSEHPLVKYRVIENLEEQGDLVTYRAEDTQLHRSVAIRVVPESAAQKLEQRQRLLRLGFLATAVILIAAVGLLADCLKVTLHIGKTSCLYAL